MLFEFNTYSGLLLPAVVHGLIFTFLLLQRGLREGRRADYLLAITVFLFTLRVANWMLGFAGWYDSHDWHTSFMFYVPWNHWFAYGPLLYFYFRSITNTSFRIRGKDWLHFVLAFLVLLGATIDFLFDVVLQHWILGEAFPFFHNTHGEMHELDLGWFGGLVDQLSFLHMLGYFVATLVAYRQYRRYLEEHFSETEEIRFSWLRNFLVAFIVAEIVVVGFELIDSLTESQLTYIDYWYSYAVWGIVVYVLSIAGYAAHPGFIRTLQFLPRRPSTTSYPTSTTVEEEDFAAYRGQLLEKMETTKPWLQPDLTLTDLGNLLGISPPLLSKMINGAFQQNFNDFINSYRVKEMQQRLLDPKLEHLSLLGIAFECGFRSKATFNRAFRKHTGQSPSDFVKSQKHGQADH